MTIANVLSVTLGVLGTLIALAALWLLEAALFPAAADRARERIARRPVAGFLTGLPATLLLFGGGIALLNAGAPPLRFAGAVLLVTGILLAGLGMGALAHLVGTRLPSPADDGRPWKPQVRGSACLLFAAALPLVGWFAVLPLVIVTGIGVAVPSVLARGAGSDPATPATAA